MKKRILCILLTLSIASGTLTANVFATNESPSLSNHSSDLENLTKTQVQTDNPILLPISVVDVDEANEIMQIELPSDDPLAFPKSGVDFSKVKTPTKYYTNAPDTLTITWIPTVTGDAVTGGELTLDEADIKISDANAEYAIILPDGDVEINLIGSNVITGNSTVNAGLVMNPETNLRISGTSYPSLKLHGFEHDIYNQGSIELAATLNFNSFTNAGEFVIKSGTHINAYASSGSINTTLSNTNTGTITNDGAIYITDLTNHGTFTNNGDLYRNYSWLPSTIINHGSLENNALIDTHNIENLGSINNTDTIIAREEYTGSPVQGNIIWNGATSIINDDTRDGMYYAHDPNFSDPDFSKGSFIISTSEDGTSRNIKLLNLHQDRLYVSSESNKSFNIEVVGENIIDYFVLSSDATFSGNAPFEVDRLVLPKSIHLNNFKVTTSYLEVGDNCRSANDVTITLNNCNIKVSNNVVSRAQGRSFVLNNSDVSVDGVIMCPVEVNNSTLNAAVTYSSDNTLNVFIYGNYNLTGTWDNMDESPVTVTIMPRATFYMSENSMLILDVTANLQVTNNGTFILDGACQIFSDKETTITNHGKMIINGQLLTNSTNFVDEALKNTDISGNGLIGFVDNSEHDIINIYNTSGEEINLLGTGLDFTNVAEDIGDLEADGYHWNNQEKILTLKNLMVDSHSSCIVLPQEHVTIKTMGTTVLHTFSNEYQNDPAISQGSFEDALIPSKDYSVTFEGDGYLRVISLSEDFEPSITTGMLTVNSGTIDCEGGIMSNGFNMSGGTLNVSKAQHGIYSLDDVTISGGTLDIHSLEFGILSYPIPSGDGTTKDVTLTISGGNILTRGVAGVLVIGGENSSINVTGMNVVTTPENGTIKSLVSEEHGHIISYTNAEELIFDVTDFYNKTNASTQVHFTKPSSGGGTSTPQAKPPVTDGENTVVEIKTNSSSIPTSVVDKAIESMSNITGNKTIEINLGTNSTTVTSTLTTSSLKDIADNKINLKISSKIADLHIPYDTLNSIVSESNNRKINFVVSKAMLSQLSERQNLLLAKKLKDFPSITFEIHSGDDTISNFDGYVELSIPYDNELNKEHLVVWYVSNDGEISPIDCNLENDNVVFKTNHNSLYAVVDFPFADIADNAWYYDSVAFAYMNDLMSGTHDTIFAPNDMMTRGMMVTILHRLDGNSSVNFAMMFDDVSDDAYYAEAVRWATSENITTGYTENSFAPNNMITREQMVVMMWRYAGSPMLMDYTGLTQYTDVSEVSIFAQQAFAWAHQQGIISGKSDTILDPQGFATRAESTAILQKFMSRTN